MNTKEWTDILKPDAKTMEAYELYRRSSDIYHRANAAMGKIEKYKVTISNSADIQISKNE